MSATTAHRCGFVTIVGRPNAGKSTLLNRIVGERVSITSDKRQTTRTAVRGMLTRPDVQIVFLDTPGIGKPRSSFDRMLNAAAAAAAHDADVICLVIDATAPYGRGDAFVASTLSSDSIVVVTKADLVKPATMITQLVAVGELDFESYFPVSGVTGEGTDALVEHLIDRLPAGPALYPPEVVSDASDTFRVAELVREQLLAVTRDELPHAIATRVTEWEWPLIRCQIIVQRPSQRAIVLGRGGGVLKSVGMAVRSQLPEGAFLELIVKVDKTWKRRPAANLLAVGSGPHG